MKFLRRFLVLIILFPLLLPDPLFSMGRYPPFEENRNLRVGIVNGEKSVHLLVDGPYEMRQRHADLLIQKGSSFEAVVTSGHEGLRLGGRPLGLSGLRVIPKRGAILSVNGKPFRGLLDIFQKDKESLLVVNHLDIEEYLYGVLPYEVPRHWPDEMLEVQAILARSFALYKKMEHRDEDYDVVATVLSQQYGGREKEIWHVRRLVDRTKGKVLMYNGTLFPTFYHSTCGGQTEDAVEATLWEEKLFPLQGVRCPYCEFSPFYRWERSFSLEDIAYRLRKAGYPVRNIQDLAVKGRTASGRAKMILIVYEKGEQMLPAPKFRLGIGPIDLRSLKFDLSVKGGRAHFKGYGWGHGAGLCQWGAMGMVNRGFSVRKILSFYYPGSEIRELPNIPWHK